MIRLIITAIFLLVFFTLSIPIFLILFIIGKFSQRKKDYIVYFIVSRAVKTLLLIAGTKLTVIGRENIPKDSSVLYVANHRSFFDIVVSYSVIGPLMGFVSKKEVRKVPILGHWMVLMHCLLLDRENIKEGLKTILLGVEKLKNNISIFIFPEGTRGKTDDSLKEFKEGSLKLAEKSGKQIVPVAFTNTSAIFEDHFPFIKKASVTMEFGKPIDITELSKEDKKKLGAYTHQLVYEMVQKNKNQL